MRTITFLTVIDFLLLSIFYCYRFFDFLSVNEIWNYILFFVSDFPLLRKNNFSLVLIESLASGVSFNDWPFETQSNLLNVVIGSLFEFCDFINLQWVLGIFKLCFWLFWLRNFNWAIFIGNVCDLPSNKFSNRTFVILPLLSIVFVHFRKFISITELTCVSRDFRSNQILHFVS